MVNDTILINGYYARGLEFFAKYFVRKNFTLQGGFNYQNPDKSSIYVSNDFEIKYLVIGSEYYFSPKTLIYLECKFDNSKNYFGNGEFNVYTLGFRFDFNIYSKEKI
jgi:predicted porin